MAQSEQIDKLAAALAKAQGQISGAEKDRENPMFRSKYSTLDATWTACRDALSTNGLAVMQTVDYAGDEPFMVTTLAHESGQWKDSRLRFHPPTDVKGVSDVQGAGSYITYLRRYQLSAIVGVAPADDDDGNGQGQPSQQRQGQQQRPPQQQKGAPQGGRGGAADERRSEPVTAQHATRPAQPEPTAAEVEASEKQSILFMERIGGIEVLPELDAWGKKHTEGIQALLPMDYDSVKAKFSARRKKLAADFAQMKAEEQRAAMNSAES